MSKREKADDLFKEMVGDAPKVSRRTEATTGAEEGELIGFTVRLPKAQKETLERHLWSQYGEKLATGARRIIVEWMRKEQLP